jgi:hypothetical protein
MDTDQYAVFVDLEASGGDQITDDARRIGQVCDEPPFAAPQRDEPVDGQSTGGFVLLEPGHPVSTAASRRAHLRLASTASIGPNSTQPT